MQNKKCVYLEILTTTSILPRSLVGLISYFQGVLDKIPSEYRDSCEVEFSVEECYGGHSSVFDLLYVRPETEEESKEREEAVKKQEEQQRARDLYQLAQIQKRLGINT